MFWAQLTQKGMHLKKRRDERVMYTMYIKLHETLVTFLKGSTVLNEDNSIFTVLCVFHENK